MKIAWLLKKLPLRYLSALAILAVGLLFLAIYSLFKGNDVRPATVSQSKLAPDYSLNQTVLCGNTLVNYNTGEIIADEWIEGFGANPPQFKQVSEQLVIVTGNNGLAGAFTTTGKPLPSPTADGQPIGGAAYNQSFNETVFIRDGNLWQGSVDWQNGKVNDPRQITDTGYFRDSVFRGFWLWHEGDILVSQLGKTLQVDLAAGSVTEVPVNLQLLQKGMSPIGTFAVIPVRGRILGIVDLLTGETKEHDLGQKIRKFLWLTPTKVAIHIGTNQVAQYDHSTLTLEGPQQSDDGIWDIVAPSPDGACFLVIGSREITVLDLKEKGDAALALPFDQVEWISDEDLLCSIDTIDTEKRGVWLVKKTGEMERLSNHPMDPAGPSGRHSTVIPHEPGALFLSGGKLWSYNLESKDLKQLTQSGELRGPIQPLAN